MRKIKFRGKDLFRGKWVYGYYKRNRYGDTYIEDTDGLSTMVSENTVGELVYTIGKNKEVYEGDYVAIRSESGKVLGIYLIEYDEELQQFDAIPQGNSPRYWDIGFPKAVGNKFDTNIENLLKKYQIPAEVFV